MKDRCLCRRSSLGGICSLDVWSLCLWRFHPLKILNLVLEDLEQLYYFLWGFLWYSLMGVIFMGIIVRMCNINIRRV